MTNSTPVIVAAAFLYVSWFASDAWRSGSIAALAPDDARFSELLKSSDWDEVTGFVSDAEPGDPAGRLFRAQYSLAPHILVRSSQLPSVLVDGATPLAAQGLLLRFNLRPVRVFAGGLILARQASD